MAELCRQQRILVNVVDVKSDCGFYFPAIIKDKEVVISVSTGGQSPVLAGTIKRNIESHLGKNQKINHPFATLLDGLFLSL